MSDGMNESLLNRDEREMPMGMGFVAAAERLDLIYLADVVAISNVISFFVEETLKLSRDFKAGLFTLPQMHKAMDESIDRLTAILKGQNPRFMATPWFTDPTQLANHLFKIYYPSFADDPELLARLRIDPIREVALLIVTTPAEDEEYFDLNTVDQFISVYARELLNIPESVPLEMLNINRVPGTTIQVSRGDGESTRRGR